MNEIKIKAIESRVLELAKCHANTVIPSDQPEPISEEELKTIRDGTAYDFSEGAFQVLGEIRIELGLEKVDYEEEYYGV